MVKVLDDISAVLQLKGLDHFSAGKLNLCLYSLVPAAFVCHHNAFLIFASLETPNQSTWKKVTHYAVAMATLFVLIVGVVGYVTFKHYTQGKRTLKFHLKHSKLLQVYSVQSVSFSILPI